MSILVPINGVNYIIPTPGETGWGSNLDAFFVAIGASTLQKTGGSFLLSGEVDFGAAFGLKSLYYKSESANIASTGALRLANALDAISWRNAANSGDLALTVNSSNQLVFNGVPVTPDAFSPNLAVITDGSGLLTTSTTTATELGYVHGVTSAIQTQINAKAPSASPTFTGSITLPANNSGGNQILFGAGTTSIEVTSTPEMTLRVNGTTALTLDPNVTTVNGALTITNPVSPEIDFNFGSVQTNVSVTSPAATRTYTLPDSGTNSNFLLSGWGQIVSADIAAGAAIPYSKLSLTNSVVNADVNTAAAIAYSKLALTASIVNADINASAAIVYSKLSLSNSIVNADIATGAAIARSKIAAGTAWRLLADDTAGAITEIGFGSSGQVLTSTGATSLPTFQNVAGTGTVNSGTAGQVAWYASSTNAVSGNTGLTVDSSGHLSGPAGSVSATSFNFGTAGTGIYSVAGASHIDFASGGSLVLDINGSEINNKVQIGSYDGTVSAPAYSFDSDLNTGIYRRTTGEMNFASSGVETFRIAPTQVLNFVPIRAINDGTASAPVYSWNSDNTTGFYRIGSHDIGISTNGVKAIEIDSSQKVTFSGPIVATTDIYGSKTTGGVTVGYVGVDDSTLAFNITNSKTLTVTIPGVKALGIYLYNGNCVTAHYSYSSALIDLVGPNESIVLGSSPGATQLGVYKSASSHVISIVAGSNLTSIATKLDLFSMGGKVTAVTDWA